MTEIPFGNPIDPQCEAKISIEMKKADNGIDLAIGRIDCGTIFCRDKTNMSICSPGALPQEAGFKAESSLRAIIQDSCPKWEALKNAGEVPQTDLPDRFMPPFSTDNY